MEDALFYMKAPKRSQNTVLKLASVIKKDYALLSKKRKNILCMIFLPHIIVAKNSLDPN